jgi:CDP-diacylglycerol--glycerol-3-phosphate 3-phosphatidyltransferase
MNGSPLLRIPLALTLLRAALGPVVVVLALTHPDEALFAICLILAFLSDYFDGVVARYLGIATANLRRLDSIADSIFYVAALLAAWHLHSELLLPYLPSLGALLALEAARYAFDYRKFGKEASYHMWSSKLWGIALFTGFFALLVCGVAGWPVSLAIYIGFLADFEGLAISLVLRRWRADVPTIFHAIRLRAAEA